jgi:hypothetical protein
MPRLTPAAPDPLHLAEHPMLRRRHGRRHRVRHAAHQLQHAAARAAHGPPAARRDGHDDAEAAAVPVSGACALLGVPELHGCALREATQGFVRAADAATRAGTKGRSEPRLCWVALMSLGRTCSLWRRTALPTSCRTSRWAPARLVSCWEAWRAQTSVLHRGRSRHERLRERLAEGHDGEPSAAASESALC